MTIAMEFFSVCHAPKSCGFFFWAASLAVVSYITVFNIVAQFELCFLFPIAYLLGQSEPYFLNTILLKCGRGAHCTSSVIVIRAPVSKQLSSIYN